MVITGTYLVSFAPSTSDGQGHLDYCCHICTDQTCTTFAVPDFLCSCYFIGLSTKVSQIFLWRKEVFILERSGGVIPGSPSLLPLHFYSVVDSDSSFLEEAWVAIQ